MAPDYLRGRLVRFRALEPGDEPLLYSWINDAEVNQHLVARYPFSMDQEREFVAAGRSSFGNAHFGIVALDDEALIGTVGLRDSGPEDRCADVGIMIGDKARWSRGYGTDTMYTACRFGFEVMNLHRIELTVYPQNERAQRIYERLGFVVEGRRREAMWRHGRYIDIVEMGLLRGELRDPGP